MAARSETPSWFSASWRRRGDGADGAGVGGFGAWVGGWVTEKRRMMLSGDHGFGNWWDWDWGWDDFFL